MSVAETHAPPPEAPTPDAHLGGPMRFTFDDLLRMRDAGVFGEEQHVELVDGEFVLMPSEGSHHSYAVTMLLEWLARTILLDPALERALALYSHASLLLAPNHRREPDLMIAGRVGPERVPSPADVRLIVECATTSAAADLHDKRLEYAAANIAEYWVWETGPQRLTVFRRPQDGDYGFKDTLTAGQSIAPLFAPGAIFTISLLST